jgi:hypothetical protein
MLTYECDPTVVFNDSKLPAGICDELGAEIGLPCASNIATGWAVGGDYVSFLCSKNSFPTSTTHCFRIDF